MIAAGQKIDTDRAERFGVQVDKLYVNPFEKRTKKRQPYTAKEIKEYDVVLDKDSRKYSLKVVPL